MAMEVTAVRPGEMGSDGVSRLLPHLESAHECRCVAAG